MAALYLTCNRNKRDIVLDVKQPAAREALLALCRDADVFVHNNRPQVMTKLGLDYEAVRAVNPRIVYCGAYGYSRKGPYGTKGALDDSIQSAAGIANLNELVLGEPRYLPTVVCDKTTAITVVYAVLAALFHRERSGEGQEIEVPMFETMVSFVMAEHLWGMTFEPPAGPPGYVRLMSEHRRPYKTLDGYIAILPYMNAHWDTFCTVAGRPDLLADPRFRTMGDRTRNIDATYAETAAIMATRTIESRRDRLITMLALPLMSCSARQPASPASTTCAPARQAPSARAIGPKHSASSACHASAQRCGSPAICAASRRSSIASGPSPSSSSMDPPGERAAIRAAASCLGSRTAPAGAAGQGPSIHTLLIGRRPACSRRVFTGWSCQVI
jgi:hypothetical protein